MSAQEHSFKHHVRSCLRMCVRACGAVCETALTHFVFTMIIHLMILFSCSSPAKRREAAQRGSVLERKKYIYMRVAQRKTTAEVDFLSWDYISTPPEADFAERLRSRRHRIDIASSPLQSNAYSSFHQKSETRGAVYISRCCLIYSTIFEDTGNNLISCRTWVVGLLAAVAN